MVVRKLSRSRPADLVADLDGWNSAEGDFVCSRGVEGDLENGGGSNW
jgi:hypothetical protein